ncbi:hypothetical protein SK854_41275 [Lentzea sp. BCCO 10_0061]|uniref:Uncharacterized protein n=1 Tax=Lentzea sokolovensis TaxID=3095429 RepID=A0ABU4VCB1_9PSEU|nr:hypothetical protein [Lentzea sp. BCCO 10_0061]MDX8148606.1 hypothetical protein [Lentzea sp. BCCO 10_0061]
MSDWDRLLDEHKRFYDPDVVVGEPSSWTRGPLAEFPQLSALLASATVTPVSAAGRSYELLAWGPAEARRGWLCDPPLRKADAPAFLERLWAVFGGIVERFGDPSELTLNLTEVLTVGATTSESIVEALPHYGWAWEDEGLTVPVEEMRPYVTVAIEANANLTAAHRETGHLVWFAPDHAADGVTPLPGCPEYSLYTYDAMPDVWSWVESIARDWQAARS